MAWLIFFIRIRTYTLKNFFGILQKLRYVHQIRIFTSNIQNDKMYLKFPLDIENSVFYLRYKTYHIRKVFWIERSNVKGSLGTLGTLVGLSRHLQEQSTNEKSAQSMEESLD